MEVDPETHTCIIENQNIDLTALEMRLLWTLFSRRGRVQSRSALLDQIRGLDADITDRAIDALVYRLRKKLGVHKGQIETIKGVGYRVRATPKADDGAGIL